MSKVNRSSSIHHPNADLHAQLPDRRHIDEDGLQQFNVVADQHIVFAPNCAFTAGDLGRCVQNAMVNLGERYDPEGEPWLGLTPNDLVAIGMATMRAVAQHGERANLMANHWRQ